MRILHISDLHFGVHHDGLRQNLLDRMSAQRPDFVVCTGDIANQPEENLLKKGREFLRELVKCCVDPKSNPLLAVPGNHDYRDWGFSFKLAGLPYRNVFSGVRTEALLESPHGKVWIFGFDSACLGAFGGSGKVDEEEIQRFHSRYEELNKTDPGFAGAVKIAAVHHHPLPVNRSHSGSARWLTMTNSGQFLTAMLFRKIDLILHGHEHLQAQAGFFSTLGSNQHEIAVSSLGATLRQVSSPNANWFSLIVIDELGVRAEFYPSVGDAWDDKPAGRPFVVKSTRNTEWKDWKEKAGYSYREIASITEINDDGDARRIIECEDLQVAGRNCERARRHPIHLPPSSGGLDSLKAGGDNIDIHIDRPIPASTYPQIWSANLKFSESIVGRASYWYRWHAVNAMAMDTRQFDFQHGQQPERLDDTEFTHYTVEDPVEDLAVIVQFPKSFTPGRRPKVRVAKANLQEPNTRNWEIEAGVQHDLESAHAFRYYPSLKVAALRVRHPKEGLSYGIQWMVPSVTPVWDPRLQAVLDRAKSWSSADQATVARLLPQIELLIVASRGALIHPHGGNLWNGPISASFMYFDGKHDLLMLAAARQLSADASHAERLDYATPVRLSYGFGIAGRAFKVNSPRVYIKQDDLNPTDEPSYYVRLEGAPEYKVIISMPLHVPVEDEEFEADPGIYEKSQPYGVLSIEAEEVDCPLNRYRDPNLIEEVLTFQHKANVLLYQSFAGNGG